MKTASAGVPSTDWHANQEWAKFPMPTPSPGTGLGDGYPILSSRNGNTIVSGLPYQYVPQA